MVMIMRVETKKLKNGKQENFSIHSSREVSPEELEMISEVLLNEQSDD